MPTSVPSRILAVVASVAVSVALGACGSSGESPSPASPDPGAEPGSPSEPSDPCEVSFSGTFDAIQETIFGRYGCAAEACHGAAVSGGLDLRPEVAWANLVEVRATGSDLPRITPGDNDRSYLWLKLAAKTNPGSVDVGGSPMPIGDTTLSQDELELLRRWIKAGAPAEGTVEDTESLIDGCLPDPEPILIEPLQPPPEGEGLQLVMPTYRLAAGSEVELCFAQYHDLTGQIPPEFQNPAGTHFRISASDLRQDPQSHHLILNGSDTSDPSGFGPFTCAGGSRDGEPCEATDLTSCGEGACRSRPVAAVGCIGVGERGAGGREQLLVAQQSNEAQVLEDGVFAEIPIKGFWVWNSHAFNLTTKDTVMHARINYTFAKNQQHVVQRIFDISDIFGQSTPPYGTETLCHDFRLPQGARLFNLISHTHKRGKHFWVDLPDGTQIYENFVYNDPTNQYYDPPLAFDSPDPSERTLTFCAYYENGVAPDGSPDPQTVKRRSTTPPNALGLCNPVACTAGDVGASCSGADDHAVCDSAPGAGDGECDACILSGGVSTEDEMFILIGAYYVQ